jgi:large subunit ribosomal protein L15
MKKLESLQSITEKPKRRLGQGAGSNRGKTAGRGMKGQKARTKIALSFEGGALPLIKRLPLLRGKGRNYSLKKDMFVVNLQALEVLPAKTVVDVQTLLKYNIISKDNMKKTAGVKILGTGQISKSLIVKLPISKSAKEKIEAAGGSIA